MNFIYSLFIIEDQFEDQFGRLCVPNKLEDSKLKVFDKIKGINESRAFAKHVSY